VIKRLNAEALTTSPLPLLFWLSSRRDLLFSPAATVVQKEPRLQNTTNPQPNATAPPQSPDQQEAKLLRRLQMMMNLVMQTVAQDGSLSIDEASQMIADARSAALTMFPGKELAYDLIWRPRFQRLMRERFRIN